MKKTYLDNFLVRYASLIDLFSLILSSASFISVTKAVLSAPEVLALLARFPKAESTFFRMFLLALATIFARLASGSDTKILNVFAVGEILSFASPKESIQRKCNPTSTRKPGCSIVVQGENVTRAALPSPHSNTRFLKTLANDDQSGRSKGTKSQCGIR